MAKPLIQLALDTQDLRPSNLYAFKFHPYVDIIEVGTILAFAQGMNSVEMIKGLGEQKIVICDMKITDGGEILARMAFNAGANIVTVSAAAHIKTIEACKRVANEFDGDTDVQIELYGKWTMDDARAWRELGISEVCYHRSRDAELAGIGWTDEDISKIKELSDMGFKVSVTGGIKPDSIHLFKGLNVHAFIVGRLLTDNPTEEAGIKKVKELHAEIDKYWN